MSSPEAVNQRAGSGELHPDLGVSAPISRRALQARRSRARRRMTRLRRSTVVALAALLAGTVIARASDSPANARPRSASVAVERSAGGARPTTDSAPSASNGTPVAPATTPSAPSTTAAPVPTTSVQAPAPPAVPAASETTVAATPTVVPKSAAGTVHPVDIPATNWASKGRVVRLSVEIEDGLTLDEAAFAATVAGVLSDPRGWQTAAGVRFSPVSAAAVRSGATVDVRVILATPTLTQRLCGPLQVSVANVSCWWGGRAVLNLHRWMNGAEAYVGDLTNYRRYLVNHEVGHGLGNRHVDCPGAGRPAPIMLQQTLGLRGCTAWPWPTRP